MCERQNQTHQFTINVVNFDETVKQELCKKWIRMFYMWQTLNIIIRLDCGNTIVYKSIFLRWFCFVLFSLAVQHKIRYTFMCNLYKTFKLHRSVYFFYDQNVSVGNVFRNKFIFRFSIEFIYFLYIIVTILRWISVK